MRFAKTILGAIAAIGVARLLAPKQTDDAVESAKRVVARGVKEARRRAADVMPAQMEAAAVRTKSATRTAARKTSAIRKAAARPRKAKA